MAKRKIDAKYRYRKLKDRCKYLGREFSIPFEVYEARLKAGCSYCGCNIENETGGGMDRKDPENFAYTEANTRQACAECNYIRGWSITEGEMEVIAKALDEYRMKMGYEKPKNKLAMARKKRKAGVK